VAIWNKKPNLENKDSNSESPVVDAPPVVEPKTAGSKSDAAESKESTNLKGAGETESRQKTPAAKKGLESSTQCDSKDVESTEEFKDALAKRFGTVRSALGPGTVIQGKLAFYTPVQIDGQLSGEIFSTKALIVGREGKIDAKVDVASLIVMGEVKGIISCSERLELLSPGVVEGSITTPILVMEEGATLNGDCKMGLSDDGEKSYGMTENKVGEKGLGNKNADKKKDEIAGEPAEKAAG